MKNYFSKEALQRLDGTLQIDRRKYAFYQIILSLLLIFPWLLIILFIERQYPWMLYVNIGFFIVCFILYIWLQFVFTEKIIRIGGKPIKPQDLIVFRRKFFVTVIEYVLPILLVKLTNPVTAVLITLVISLGRFAWMYFDLLKRQNG